LGGGGKEPEIRVSSEALFLLEKIKRVYLGLERGLGLNHQANGEEEEDDNGHK